MPNWIEGTLKVRGKIENVKRFFFEGLNYYGNCTGFEADPVPDAKESWMEIVDNKEYGYYYIDFDVEPHVEGTNRAFVFADRDHPLYYEEEWNEPAVAVMKVRQAWGFREEEWSEISKRFDVDIRLFGIERGMEFCREIEIIKGKVTMSKRTEYENWDWECPFPYLGG